MGQPLPVSILELIMSHRDIFKKGLGQGKLHWCYILDRHSPDKEKVMFVGDAESNMKAANTVGVAFIPFNTPESGTLLMECSIRISNLTELHAAVMGTAR